jgi:hypothetical protein
MLWRWSRGLQRYGRCVCAVNVCKYRVNRAYVQRVCGAVWLCGCVAVCCALCSALCLSLWLCVASTCLFVSACMRIGRPLVVVVVHRWGAWVVQVKRTFSGMQARVDEVMRQRSGVEATAASHGSTLAMHQRRIAASQARMRALEEQEAATRCEHD